ncbi:MAG TPA: STAS domain-containing protein [Streptosporangiaceae bacterium]|jgi:anti-sigma B factor antagonist
MFWAHFSTDCRSSCAVVELHGELDLATGRDLADLLATTTAGAKVTIVDLAALEFLDCAGLRALVRAREQAGRDGHALLLAAPAAPVRQVLDMTGATRLFSTHASVAAAADCGAHLLIGG